jgi:hypothetical protein
LTVDPNSIAHRDIELETRCLGDDVFFDAVPSRNPKPGGLKSDDQTSRDGQHGAIIPWASSSHTHMKRPWPSRFLNFARPLVSPTMQFAAAMLPLAVAYELSAGGHSFVRSRKEWWFSAYIRGIFLDAQMARWPLITPPGSV